MALPNLPPILELEVSMPGVELGTSPDDAVVLAVLAEGPPGPPGPAGDGGFTHTQSAPAATWTIPNTLGRFPASVLIVVDNAVVMTDVEFPDLSTIVVTFATPQTGRVEVI